jgi:hypothetical protein
MKFLVSYAQTSWRYGLFRLNRIVQGRSPWVQKLLLVPVTDVFAGDPGGEIALYERGAAFGSIRKLASLACTKPFGMDHVPGEGLYHLAGPICAQDGVAGDEHVVRRNARGEVDLEVRSPLFNLVRTVQRTEHGLLLSASGIDAVLEVDLEGKLLWAWWATRHGYDTRKSGERRAIDEHADHRLRCYPSHVQTTHVNSAIVDPFDPGKVLAVLFYQGCVVRIDRRSLRHEVVIRGLNGPHHVRASDDGYSVSDTRNGLVRRYDREFRPLPPVAGSNERVPRAFRWTQDAIPTPWGSWLVADGNRFRLLELDGAGREAAHRFGMPRRVFQLLAVPDDFRLGAAAEGARA